jgi:hypothetical protein
LVSVTQALGALSRNCERFAAVHCGNRLRPEGFLDKA